MTTTKSKVIFKKDEDGFIKVYFEDNIRYTFLAKYEIVKLVKCKTIECYGIVISHMNHMCWHGVVWLN